MKERCRAVHEQRAAEVVRYQVSFEEDEITGLKLGCTGTIDVLFQPSAQLSFLPVLQNSLSSRLRYVMATIVAAPDDFSSEVGGHVVYNHSNIKNQALAQQIREFVEGIVAEAPNLMTLTFESKAIDLFIEPIVPPLRLVIFGAGNDSIPLAQLGALLGWQVIVIDRRSALLNRQRFAAALLQTVRSYESLDLTGIIDYRTACVVMTHNYADDLKLLGKVLESPCFYAGFLGPKKRTVSLLQEVACDRGVFSESALQKLYAPTGLNLGAETPEEIALSAVAEIQAVVNRQSAGFLRDKKGPIHNQTRQAAATSSPAVTTREKLSCPSQ